MDYRNIIPKIKSIRNYKETSVSSEILEELKRFYKNDRNLIKDIEIDIIIKSEEEVYEKTKDDAGYNEYMIKAPHYLIILSEDKEHYIENAGYVGQNIMLKAHELGVGSCWITFKDGEKLKRRLNIQSDKKFTGFISLGYDDNKNKVVYENVSEYNPSRAEVDIVEDNTSPRRALRDFVYMKKWGENAEADELINRGLFNGLNMARLAPSSKNRQPWRFIVDDDVLVLALQSDSYIDKYEEKIDAGIVMLYFEVIIDSTIFDLSWQLGKPNKKYDIPEDFTIVGYCNV